jgi:hypothetical protein
MKINYKKLRSQYEKYGATQSCRLLRVAIDGGDIDLGGFSIRQCAEEMIGRAAVEAMDPRNGSTAILEAGDGVDTTAFSNITGQLLISKIMESYTQEAFVLSSIIPNISTRLDGEKIPGIAKLKEDTQTVHPGMPYPSMGFGEDYVETPATTKRGFIVPVTKEAVFFDRTNLILSRAAEVGEVLGINKEKRLLDMLIGVTNNYKWKVVTYDTYSTTGTGATSGHAGGRSLTGVINELTNMLVDWTDLDEVEQLFANILDPNTDEPVLITANQVLVCPAYRHALNRIINATEIRYTASGAATETIASNPLNGYTGRESRLMYRRLIASGVSASDAAKYWFVGDFARAFAYMENWPITVTQAPANSEAEFTQDIVARFKVSERGAAAVINPRYVVMSTGTT